MMKNLLMSAFILAILCGCTVQPGETKSLPGAEVLNYHGKNLSSVDAVFENAINGPQYIDIGNYTLNISGMVDHPSNLTYSQVLSLQKYSKVVTINCVEGWNATILWEGVKLSDLLDQAGVQNGSNTVIFLAADGYSTSLPLDYIKQRDILLAYKMNNLTLTPERGFPFMVVAEDKWGYKWIKWVTAIEVSNDPNYKGYWESRGYSNGGNLNESMFG